MGGAVGKLTAVFGKTVSRGVCRQAMPLRADSARKTGEMPASRVRRRLKASLRG